LDYIPKYKEEKIPTTSDGFYSSEEITWNNIIKRIQNDVVPTAN
jgi:hypothetical protein